jgi:tetratricopeptide (TPR) repeat protein
MRTTPATAAALAAAILSMLLVACGGADTRRGEHMQRGQEYFAAENWEKARVEFRNALQVTPDDPNARFMNARVAEKLNNLSDAARLYQATIDVAPDHIQARAALGRMYVFGGAPDRAIEMVKPGLVTHPDDPDLLTVRSAARAQQNDRAGALEDAEKANKLAPDNENAAAMLASLYQQKGEGSRAIEVISKTLEKAPKSLDLRQVLASLYSSAGDNDRAEQELKKIVELKPTELRHRINLALSYIRSKRLDDADHTLVEAVKALPGNSQAKLAYVDFLVAQRSMERGVEVLKQYIASEPKDYDLQFGLGALQQRSSKPDDAIATYGKIIAADKDGVSGLSARLRIATMHVGTRRFDDASKLIAEVLAKNPRDNDALILRGNIELEQKDPAAAIADLRAVLRDQPRSLALLRTIARAYVANGDNALAEDSLRAAVEAAPTDIPTRIELAKLLSQTRRNEPAITILEDAVKQAPQDVPAREALARAYLDAGQFDAARRAAEDLKLAAPTLAAGPYIAGLVALAQKRPDDAQKELEKALQVQPSAGDALTAITKLDMARGRTPAALARVKGVADADPKNFVARNLLGELYIASKQPDKAIESFAQTTQIAATWPVPYRNIALVKLSSKDTAGAISAYESGLQPTGYDAALVTDLATLYESQKRVDDAIRLYDELRKRHPQLELAANNLAMLLVTYKTDQASLDRARDLSAPFASSSIVAFLDTHGWVRFKRGEFTQAVPALERAVSESPNSKVLRFHLGMAQYKSGQRDQAITNLEKALDGGAKFNGADEARTVLSQLKGSSAG